LIYIGGWNIGRAASRVSKGARGGRLLLVAAQNIGWSDFRRKGALHPACVHRNTDVTKVTYSLVQNEVLIYGNRHVHLLSIDEHTNKKNLPKKIFLMLPFIAYIPSLYVTCQGRQVIPPLGDEVATA